MGRPLKIAKGVIVTLTATNGTTEVATASSNFATLNIVAGMPFVPASTAGGLTGGTTYYVLQVLSTGASSTFTVSSEPLSANPNYTKVNLSTAAGLTVALSFNLVDTGFANPATAAASGGTSTNPGATYGVVGGNTTLYGSQTLVRAAIGISGTGTIYTSTGTADVYGSGTDFSNTVSAGSAIQIINQQTGNATNVGFVSSIGGYITEAITDTEATGSFVVTSGDATNFAADAPITFDGNIGGLTTDTTYFVLTGANTTHFQVSTTLGGAAVAVSNDTQSVNATQDVLTLGASASANSIFNTNPMASWVYADDEAAFIVRQKGKTKYLVTGATSGLTAPCYTANVANTALTPNTMNILGTYANTSTVYVQSLNDYNSIVFYDTSNANAYPSIVGTFGTAYAANTYGGQPQPIVTIANT
jgi:hypothetical protein